jgi:uncharacterized membrane protein YbhN (UPF0104 family)
VKTLLRIAVAVVLLALVWRSVDGAAALVQLRSADPALLALALGLLSGQIVLSALRWSLTAHALGQPLGWRVALREYHLGMLLNMTLPGGVLGDVGRALRARANVGVAAAAQGVMIERMCGQLALFVVLAVGLALWPAAAGWGLTAVAAGLAAVAGGAAALVVGPPPLRRFGRGLMRVWTPWRRAFAQVAVNAGAVGCLIGAMAACSAAVGAPLGTSALVVVPLTLTAMLVPVSVGGWGLREGAATVVWPLAGLSAQAGLAASIAFGLMALAAALPGLLVALRLQADGRSGARDADRPTDTA